jgi:radical SAM superfamily enzyme YgiQ (UPF0313 family)
MKIILIAPATGDDRSFPKYLTIPPLALYILKGLTPPHFEVKVHEENLNPIDFDEDCDLVGISSMTPTVTRAYKIADEFRKRNKTVIIGGIHATALPDEALNHADSVLIGEAEDIWEKILNDFSVGKLQKKYSAPLPDLQRYINIDSSLVENRKGVVKIHSSETNRGCPYTCEFCNVPVFYGRKMRQRPIENVLKDIELSKGKFFIFHDDNVLGKPTFAREFFTRLIPFKIKWIGQCSLTTIERNPDLLDIMVKSGCQALFFGIENVSGKASSQLKKSVKDMRTMEDLIKRIISSGIHFHSSLIFGFDTDDVGVFDTTLEFLQRNQVPTSSICIMTPYPGTVLYENMKNENRLLTSNWKYYTGEVVVIKPRLMTPDQLQDGFLHVKKEFSRFSNVMRRFPRNWRHPLVHFLGNMAYHSEVDFLHEQWNTYKTREFSSVMPCEVALE